LNLVRKDLCRGEHVGFQPSFGVVHEHPELDRPALFFQSNYSAKKYLTGF
jgi:hypothetical protein